MLLYSLFLVIFNEQANCVLVNQDNPENFLACCLDWRDKNFYEFQLRQMYSYKFLIAAGGRLVNGHQGGHWREGYVPGKLYKGAVSNQLKNHHVHSNAHNNSVFYCKFVVKKEAKEKSVNTETKETRTKVTTWRIIRDK